MNSGNSKTSVSHRLLLNLLDKINLLRINFISLYYTWKNIKNSYKNNEFKISAPTSIEGLEWLEGHILYQIFKIILSISSRNLRQLQIIIQ